MLQRLLVFHSPKKLVKLKRNIDDQLQAGEDPAVIKDTSKQTKEAMTKKILQPLRITGVENIVYLLQLFFFFPTTSPDILCFV